MTVSISALHLLTLAQAFEGFDLGEAMELLYQLANFELFTIGDHTVTPISILIVILLILVALFASRVAQGTVDRAFKRRGVDPGTAAVTKRLLHYAVMAIGLSLAIQQVGIDLTALFAAGAIFAVGLGFAMQNIAQNFVSGLILLIERAIKPGDIVEVEDRVLRVLKMGIRTTIARTRDDEEVLIPNSSLVQSAVKNFTLADPLFRIRVSVGVSYDSDMRKVRSILEKAGKQMDWGPDRPEPAVLLTEFGGSSVDWEVSVWCTDVWVAPRLASTLRESIWWALKEAEITIAYPQLDLHLDPPVQDALERIPRSA